jgi:hypothetical protein
MKIRNWSLLFILILAGCSSSIPTQNAITESVALNDLNGLLYVHSNETGGSSTKSFDATLLNSEGEKNILGKLSIHNAFDSAFQFFQNSIYYISPNGGLEAFNLADHTSKKITIADITTLGPINDFKIAPDGTLYALQGICTQEAEVYDCNLSTYSIETGQGNLLHKMEPVGLWGGANLKSADTNQVLYEIILGEDGSRDYYRFNVAEKHSQKLYQSRCSLDEKPCDIIIYESGFTPPQKNIPSSCGEISIDSSEPPFLVVTTKAGRLDHYLGIERFLACLNN